MARVLSFSQAFPAYHPKKGEQTFFVEKFWNSFNVNYAGSEFLSDFEEQVWFLNKQLPYTTVSEFLKKRNKGNREIHGQKNHTIRQGKNWKPGDLFSPRVWSGVPYHSKQIIIANNMLVEKVWDFEINGGEFKINNKVYGGESESIFELLESIAFNDGLDRHDLMAWFKYPKPFSGQIICWNKETNY